MATPKSMPVFFIDNQGLWPKGAKLLTDIVVSPDAGKYPTFIPVAAAEHPNYNGKVVVMAGNRGIVVSFVPGAQSSDDVRKSLSKGNCEQYRIAVDAIIHRLVLMREETEGGGAAHPLALLNMLATQDPVAAQVLVDALKTFMNNAPEGKPSPKDWEMADEMRSSLENGLNPEQAPKG